jgi:hypothetical protein
MSDRDLYDSARCWWRLDPQSARRRGIGHAVAVHQGITRALFTIERWTRRVDGRWCFDGERVREGTLFEEAVGERGRQVTFPQGSANPIRYWPS